MICPKDFGLGVLCQNNKLPLKEGKIFSSFRRTHRNQRENFSKYHGRRFAEHKNHGKNYTSSFRFNFYFWFHEIYDFWQESQAVFCLPPLLN